MCPRCGEQLLATATVCGFCDLAVPQKDPAPKVFFASDSPKPPKPIPTAAPIPASQVVAIIGVISIAIALVFLYLHFDEKLTAQQSRIELLQKAALAANSRIDTLEAYEKDTRTLTRESEQIGRAH